MWTARAGIEPRPWDLQLGPPTTMPHLMMHPQGIIVLLIQADLTLRQAHLHNTYIYTH